MVMVIVFPNYCRNQNRNNYPFVERDVATETTYRIDDSYDLSVVASIDTMYVLEDGYLLPTLVQDAFCRRCNSIELVEVIPTFESLQIELANDEPTVEHQLRLEWRPARTSPPRCIYCGNSDYFALDLKSASVDPVTGKRFVWSDGVFFEANHSLKIRLHPDGTVITTWRPRFQ
jgi:hypothetical protein